MRLGGDTVTDGDQESRHRIGFDPWLDVAVTLHLGDQIAQVGAQVLVDLTEGAGQFGVGRGSCDGIRVGLEIGSGHSEGGTDG